MHGPDSHITHQSCFWDRPSVFILPWPYLSVPHTDKQAVAPADCAGVTRCLLYSRVIYSFRGKKSTNKQSPPCLLSWRKWTGSPASTTSPQCHPALSPRERATREEKKLLPVVHTQACALRKGERAVGEGEEVEGRGREEKGPP